MLGDLIEDGPELGLQRHGGGVAGEQDGALLEHGATLPEPARRRQPPESPTGRLRVVPPGFSQAGPAVPRVDLEPAAAVRSAA